MTVLFAVGAAGVLAMLCGMRGMAVRGMGVMRRFFVFAGLVMLGRLGVMMRRARMMFRSFLMMFCSFARHTWLPGDRQPPRAHGARRLRSPDDGPLARVPLAWQNQRGSPALP